MRDINLSINPTYLCNFRCHFCYLTKIQLSDAKRIDLSKLEEMLIEVSAARTIRHVDIYGGEIGMLSNDYLERMMTTLRGFTPEPINIITNLSEVSPIFLNDDVDLAVSWDYKCRQDYKKVLTNIMNIDKEVHILMLASPKMLEWSDSTIDEVVEIFNSVSNIATVEIKPYSQNQANYFQDTDLEFEKFIIKWLQKAPSFKFDFINAQLIKESLNKERNAWSDDHLYITPNGNWTVLDFDENDREFFLELQSFSEYEKWCQTERKQIESNFVCKQCNYLGHCLSEHLRHVLPTDKSCSGFKNLLNWSKSHLDY